MELIRNWILGVTCAAMLVAVADSVTPPGTVKKLAKLTGGLVLLLAVIRPLMGLDYQSLSLALAENRFEWEEDAAGKGSALGTDLMKSIIAERTGAYILDKANALGVRCAVEVECAVGEENLPYPVSVCITGKLTQSQRETLEREIEADFAIPADQQLYESGDVE